MNATNIIPVTSHEDFAIKRRELNNVLKTLKKTTNVCSRSGIKSRFSVVKHHYLQILQTRYQPTRFGHHVPATLCSWIRNKMRLIVALYLSSSWKMRLWKVTVTAPGLTYLTGGCFSPLDLGRSQ